VIYGHKQIRAVLAQLAAQKLVDERLREEFQSDAHSLEHPLVLLDPYGDAPLSAVVLFRTEVPTKIRVSISLPGERDNNVEFVFATFETHHLVPIYGLYPDADNVIMLVASDESGNVETNTLHIKTGELHAALQNVCVDVLQRAATTMRPGFTFMYKSNPKFAFDGEGRIRWILDLPTNMATLYDFRGHIIATSGVYLGGSLLYEVDLLGRFHSVSFTPYGAHHDIEEIPGGKLLVTGSRMRPTIKDLLYEFDPETGDISNVMDFRKILDPARPSRNRSNWDWLHMNAVVWSDSDHSIIVSGRNQSVIVKMSYPEGTVKWMLGYHDDWLPGYMKHLLTPVREGFLWPHSQHSPVLLPDQDGNPDTVDIVVFDNRSYMDKRSVEAASEARFSRLVQYRIDEKAKTVEQIREFGRDRGHDLFTHHCGCVDHLDNGNFLSYFNLSVGHRTGYSRVMELSDDLQDVVFDAVVYSKVGDSFGDYRCARRELYSASDNDLWKLESCKGNLPRQA
jgi:arylsulfate sulfotransferase